jgi:uncharacterized oligopeptide transporter (OPT) family protein
MIPAFQAIHFVIGAVAAWIFGLRSKTQAERLVIPISSGLIAGESIAGVVVAALNTFVLV